MKSKRAKERLFAATDWFEEVNMDLVYKSGAEEAILLAEQDVEESCINNIFEILCKIQGTTDKIVCILKNDNGYYLANYFTKKPIEHSRCISKYVALNNELSKGNILNYPYYLTSFTCNNKGCEVGKPKIDCQYNNAKGDWTYTNPRKCACWSIGNLDRYLENIIPNIYKLLNEGQNDKN